MSMERAYLVKDLSFRHTFFTFLLQFLVQANLHIYYNMLSENTGCYVRVLAMWGRGQHD